MRMIHKSNSTWFDIKSILNSENIKQHFPPSILALQSLITILLFLDRLKVHYYPAIHRVTVDKVFKLGFNPTPILLILSATTITLLLIQKKPLTASIPILISALLYPLTGWGNSIFLLSSLLIIGSLLSKRNLGEYVFWILTFGTGFELIALIHWVSLPFGCALFKKLANFELSLFYVLARITPYIALPISFLWMAKLFVKRLNIPFPRKNEINQVLLQFSDLFLALALLFSIIVALYPYAPEINPDSQQVGVDQPHYVECLEEVGDNPAAYFKVLGGSRPLIFLLLYALSKSLNVSFSTAVKYLPLLLNPLLTLSTYILVYKASYDRGWASLSALLMTLGIKMTVGMYSYFLTNNLGLILLYASLGLLFKTLQNGRLSTLLYASAFGSLTLFVHPWTTTQYLTSLTLLTLHLYLKEKDLKASTYLLLYFLIIGIVDLLKMTLLRGIELYGSLASAPLKLMAPEALWRHIRAMFAVVYGGFLSNNLLWLLAALGILQLDTRRPFELYLLLLLPPSSTYALLSIKVMSRFIYNLPLSIYSAKALISILRSRTERSLKASITAFTLTYMTVYLLRSLANLV